MYCLESLHTERILGTVRDMKLSYS